jgi:hypothetical protein
MAMKIQVKVFSVVMLCSVVGYKCFGGQCCLHLQGEVNGTVKKCVHITPEHKRGPESGSQ